jgi:hypothetical protein
MKLGDRVAPYRGTRLTEGPMDVSVSSNTRAANSVNEARKIRRSFQGGEVSDAVDVMHGDVGEELPKPVGPRPGE